MSALRVLWWVTWAAWAGVVVLERVTHRAHWARFRAVQARWRATSKMLSMGERREVGQAVRRGEPVADPDLADAAVDLAEVLVTRPPRGWMRWLADGLFTVWLLVPLINAAARQNWTALAFLSLTLAAFGAAIVSLSRPPTNAQAALVANRRVPRPRPPAAPVERQELNLGVGLPDAVARARRRRDPGSPG